MDPANQFASRRVGRTVDKERVHRLVRVVETGRDLCGAFGRIEHKGVRDEFGFQPLNAPILFYPLERVGRAKVEFPRLERPRRRRTPLPPRKECREVELAFGRLVETDTFRRFQWLDQAGEID